jgi:hypothetical protein
MLIWPAMLVELVAGAMLLVGWKARWAAIVWFCSPFRNVHLPRLLERAG